MGHAAAPTPAGAHAGPGWRMPGGPLMLGQVAARAVTGGSTVLLTSSGWQAVGASGGIIGGLAGLVGTYVALRASARTARSEYQKEMTAAEQRGVEKERDRCAPQLEQQKARIAQLEQDLGFYRSRVYPQNPQSNPPPGK